MNKEKLQNLFNKFLVEIEKLENLKAKYQNWYDADWKLIMTNSIDSEWADFEYDLLNAIKDEIIFGENENDNH